jgi:hypothetical protein
LPLQRNVPLLEVRNVHTRIEAGGVRETSHIAGFRHERFREAEQRYTIGDGIEVRNASAERTTFKFLATVP